MHDQRLRLCDHLQFKVGDRIPLERLVVWEGRRMVQELLKRWKVAFSSLLDGGYRLLVFFPHLFIHTAS